MSRLSQYALLLAAALAIGSTGCCCMSGPCGGHGAYGGHVGGYGGCSGCGDVGCAGGCADGGCGGGCGAGYGGCSPCGGCHPIASAAGLIGKLFTCGAGCGGCYMGPGFDHPGACCDPCDVHGCHTGACGHHRPVLGGLRHLWGHHYHGCCDTGCSSCGCGGGCSEGGGAPGGCGCHGGGAVHGTPLNAPTPMPAQARTKSHRKEPLVIHSARASHVSTARRASSR